MTEKRTVDRILRDMAEFSSPPGIHTIRNSEVAAEHKRRDAALGEGSGHPPAEVVSRPMKKY